MANTVGIGIIGTGFPRRVQIPAFLLCQNARVTSVASGSLANARSCAEEFSVGHFTSDWRETVMRKDVDLVCITTPPYLHLDMALFALENKKHILCEKPMAMNVAEAEEMSEAAKTAGVLAFIDHELRFQPGRQLGWKLLREGAIGKVRHAKYNFRAPHRGDPLLPWNWWSDIESGGGALGAINSHVIDSFNWFLGAEVSSVFCQLQTHVTQRPFENGFREVTTDDEATMLLRFADGELTYDATGMVSVSMVEQPEYLNRIEFFGTEGSMRIDRRGEIYLGKNEESQWTPVENDPGENIAGAVDTGFSRGFLYFAPKVVEAIIDGSSNIEHAATFEDGLKVQQVLDAARQSDRKGIAVDT